MFGNNEIVGKKWFKIHTGQLSLDKKAAELMVTSIFFTLQGEGPYSGRPSLFLRLAKCNLACSFCDTFFDQGDWMSFTEIKAKLYNTLCEFWNNKSLPVPLWALPYTDEVGGWSAPDVVLVITGGEPFLQDNLFPFLEFMKPCFNTIQIESNGILTPSHFPSYVTLVCSPKCNEVDGQATAYFKPSKQMLDAAFCLKFVMSSDLNSPYSKVPDWAFEWRDANPGRSVYVSPMNIYNQMPQKAKELRAHNQGEISLETRSTIDEVVSFWEEGLLDMKANRLNHEYAARYAITHGFRLTLQTHLMASLA